MKAKVAALPGDGIGEEVMTEALRVLGKVAELEGHVFEVHKTLVGGAAFEQSGNHFPDDTKKVCEESDAILFGSVGGPVAEQHLEKWRNCEARSLLAIRKHFGFQANFRPARVYPALSRLCPLKAELIGEGIDILIIRELLGDLYFGAHERMQKDGRRFARDIAEYDEAQIRAVALQAFKAATVRRAHVTSVDKANVLETGKLWREVVSEVAKEYPSVTLEHMLVDNCAMQLIRRPAHFDVILTPNMFGDILSDEAAVLPGSLGLTPSASLNAKGFGLYEPSGGSAPDIAGKGIANPIAQILSVALMLRYSFEMESEAARIESAVNAVIADGVRTADIALKGEKAVSTKVMTDSIIAKL